MSRGNFPSAKSPQAVIRLPDGMRESFKSIAKQNGRSMNTEMVVALDAYLTSNGVAPPTSKPYNARLDTFVAAALSGLVAKHGNAARYEDALEIGADMLAYMENAS